MANLVQNNMTAIINVLEPPIKKTVLGPIKDASLAYDAPYLNLGKGYELAIGKIGEAEKYRSVLAFDIPLISQTDMDNLIYAKIQLTAIRPIIYATKLCLYVTAKSDWSETGVNWVNQPSNAELVTEVNVEMGAKSITFDITDYFKKNNLTQIFSFSICDDSGTMSGIPLTFGSRESGDTPTLEYVWKYYPPNAASKILAGCLTTRQIANSSLAGSVTITKGLCETHVDGSLQVSNKHENSTFDGSIFIVKRDISAITGSLDIVKAIGTSSIEGNMTVRSLDTNNINGSLTVKSIIESNNLAGSMVVRSRNIVNGSLDVVKLLETPNINGSIIVNAINTTDLDGSLTLKASKDITDISGGLTVKCKVNLDGSLTLKALKDITDISGGLTVKCKVNLDGSLTLKVLEDINNITGGLTVKCIENKNLNGSLTFKALKEASDINGGIKVRAINTNNITGSLTVKQHGIDAISGTLTSRARINTDIVGTLTVGTDGDYVFIM